MKPPFLVTIDVGFQTGRYSACILLLFCPRAQILFEESHHQFTGEYRKDEAKEATV